MPNIKFNYLYRDSCNYKNFGSIIFDNPQDIDLKELETLVRSNLIDETWFYASQWNLSNLFFTNSNSDTDPSWHEFENIEYTSDLQQNTDESLAHFTNAIMRTKLFNNQRESPGPDNKGGPA